MALIHGQSGSYESFGETRHFPVYLESHSGPPRYLGTYEAEDFNRACVLAMNAHGLRVLDCYGLRWFGSEAEAAKPTR